MNDPRILPLKRHLDVCGIPMVIVVHNNGGHRVHSGRLDVEEKGPLPEVIREWIRLAGGDVESPPPSPEPEVVLDLIEEMRQWKIKVRETNILIIKT